MSPPLRNVGMQAAFFHNGSFTRLEDAIRHHLDVLESARGCSPLRAGLDRDLTLRIGPIEPVLNRIDPLLATPRFLRADQIQDSRHLRSYRPARPARHSSTFVLAGAGNAAEWHAAASR